MQEGIVGGNHGNCAAEHSALIGTKRIKDLYDRLSLGMRMNKKLTEWQKFLAFKQEDTYLKKVVIQNYIIIYYLR